MIPKIIHLCWLSGDQYPALVNKCIESWKKNLPDYEIMLWDRNRFDITSVPWVKQAYDNKKYAFAADYIRFYALYNYGGIYLDSDVEVLKSFNDLLNRREFIGEDAAGSIEAAVIGAEKGLDWVKECLDYYDGRSFVKEDGSFDMVPVPILVTKVITNNPDINLFDFDYFSPKDYNVGKIYKTKNSYTIHHFEGKWETVNLSYKVKKMIHIMMYYTIGRKLHNKIIHFWRSTICG